MGLFGKSFSNYSLLFIYLTTLLIVLSMGRKLKHPRCGEPIDKGMCGFKYNRYHYNPDARKCYSFFYRGCGSGGNNFKSFKHCLKFCQD